MISYEFYKVVHLFSIVLMLTGLSISFFEVKSKSVKILTGIGTLFTLVGGMGLLARLGINHGEAWPVWVKAKMTIWFIIGIGGAVVARRFSSYGKFAYPILLILFLSASLFAVFKFE